MAHAPRRCSPLSSLLTRAPLGAALLLLALGSATIVGCASGRTSAERIRSATAHIEDPIRALEARAELEALDPGPPAGEAVLTRITQGAIEQLTPGSPAYQRAITDQQRIIEEARSGHELDRRQAQSEIDPARRNRALKLYTQARALRQGGELKQAGELLTRAASLDPGSAAIQRELGETLVVSNDRVGAIQAYTRAIELGDRSPRTLVHAASDAATRGEHEQIIRLTSLVLDDPSTLDDPLARSIAGVLLGGAELNSGYLRAGARALSDALESFDSGSRDPRWRREIIQITTQKAQLWILAGDAWASIGAHQRARDAYEQAGADLENPPPALVARRLVSELRRGRWARAALIFLDHLQRHETDLGSEEPEWASALASGNPAPKGGLGPELAGAIRSLEARPGLTPSIKRSLLLVELAAMDPQRGVLRLGSAGLDANDALACLGVLSGLGDDRARIGASLKILEENPDIARALASALIRTIADPLASLSGHAKPGSASAELLWAAVGVNLGRADLIGHLDRLELKDAPERSSAWVSIHAQALALAGLWDASDRLVAVLEARAEDPEHSTEAASVARRLASTLVITQQPRRALALARGLSESADASVEDLLLAGQIAQTLQAYDEAVDDLERASELDPYNEKIYEQLFVLRSSSSPVGDEDELKHIVRQLGTMRPRSSLFGLMRASELARNNLLDESEALLVALNSQSRQREIGYDLLLSIWKTREAQGEPQALASGISWLESRLDEDPNSAQAMMTIAQGLYELDANRRALALLEAGYARTGSFDLARAIEQLLAESLDEPGRAHEHVVDRLSALMGVDPTIEYGAYLARREESGSGKGLLDHLRAGLPDGIELLPGQRDQLAKAVFTMTNSVGEHGNGEEILGLISIIEAHTPGLGFQLSRAKLLLSARREELDLDDLIGVIEHATAQTETDEQRDALVALPVQSLLSDDRPHEAIALTARLATRSDDLDENLAVETFRLLGAVGVNADMIGVLDLFEQRGVMARAIELTTTRLGTPRRAAPAATSDEQHADLAYTAAAMASAFSRDEQAKSYYELSLSYNPAHPWSNNDLGYMLAETGERMDEAQRMLELAAAALPEEASIIDSLAWVRYKLGIFDDVLDSSGGVETPGAISLLLRARELDTSRENATILLHLGDALWRGGRKDRAGQAWLDAEGALRTRIRVLGAQENPNQRAIQALSEELREVRYRIQDAEASGSPKLAPLADEPAPPDGPTP